MTRQMKLGLAFQPFGCHRASWRHPDVPATEITDFDLHVAITKRGEEGLFDFLFMADALVAVWGDETPETVGRQPPTRPLDPLMLIMALAPLTRHIGLVATVNTTYSAPPFTIARMLATIDHVSGGRAGWNLVTGANPEESRNFSDQPHPPAAERYERAHEFAEVMFGLWDSWDPGAFIQDKESGLFFDPAKMHLLNHHGKYFHSRGPLTAPRCPQGRPVTVQAGNSHAGRELAAATAEVVFSIAPSFETAKAFYDDVKGRMARFGRHPDEMKILPGVQIFVDHSEEGAIEKLAVMEASYDMVNAVHQLSLQLGADLRDYPLDGPVPELEAPPGGGSRRDTLMEIARRGNLSVRQLAMQQGTLGHWILTGTPASIVDQLEQYFDGAAADGFIVQPPYMMGALDDFVEMVVPELQRRGLYRTHYEGRTLRDRLGLREPVRGAGSEVLAEL